MTCFSVYMSFLNYPVGYQLNYVTCNIYECINYSTNNRKTCMRSYDNIQILYAYTPSKVSTTCIPYCFYCLSVCVYVLCTGRETGLTTSPAIHQTRISDGAGETNWLVGHFTLFDASNINIVL